MKDVTKPVDFPIIQVWSYFRLNYIMKRFLSLTFTFLKQERLGFE